MFKELKSRQEAGMVLVTVIMIIMVLAVLTVSIISQNLNQSNSAQAQLETIKAQELAQGAYWKVYANMYAGGPPSSVGLSTTMDGKTFTVAVSPTPANYQVNYYVNVTY